MNIPDISFTCVDRFLKYVKYDTQSSEESTTYPSTEKQKILGAELVKELLAIGLSDAEMDEHGYVITEAGTPQYIHGNAPATVCLEHVGKAAGRLCAGVVHRDRMTKGQHNLGPGRQGKEE